MLPELDDVPESLRALARELGELEAAAGPDGEASELPDLSGTDFRPLQLIARGGMGVVYEAEQLSLGRRVAVKLFAGDIEPRMIARLHHPHIIQVFAAGTVRGRGYFAMELMGGETAATRVFSSVDEIVGLGQAVAEALAHAHREGLLHRDVKPANIFFDGDGIVKLGDFGLARAVRETRPNRSGTARFMAPELAGRGEVSERTDQYALGVTLIELLRRADLVAEPDLAAVLAKATAYDPAVRYASAADFAEDLRAYRRGAPVAARPPRLSRRLAMWVRRNPLAAVCTAIALAVFVGAAVYAGRVRHDARAARRTAEAARQSEEEARQSAEEAASEAQRLRSSMGKILYRRRQLRSAESQQD